MSELRYKKMLAEAKAEAKAEGKKEGFAAGFEAGKKAALREEMAAAAPQPPSPDYAVLAAGRLRRPWQDFPQVFLVVLSLL